MELKVKAADMVAVFRETAKGMGRLKLHPHEAYEEELKITRDTIHVASVFTAGAEAIYSQDADFDSLKGLKRKWI